MVSHFCLMQHETVLMSGVLRQIQSGLGAALPVGLQILLEMRFAMQVCCISDCSQRVRFGEQGFVTVVDIPRREWSPGLSVR